MSAGEVRVQLDVAERIASDLVATILPYVTAVEIAGSVRRGKADVGDIEIVAMPRMVPVQRGATGSLFGDEQAAPDLAPDLAPIRAPVATWGEKVLDGTRQMSRLLPSGIKAELYLVHPWPQCTACKRYVEPEGRFALEGSDRLDLPGQACPWCEAVGAWRWTQWGSILAIRTGPADLGHFAVSRLPAYGLKHDAGRIQDGAGAMVPTPTEESFFALCGLPCVPPDQRAYEQAKRVLSDEQRAAALGVRVPAPPATASAPAARDYRAEASAPRSTGLRDVMLVDMGNLVSRAWYTLASRRLEDLGPKVLHMLRGALRRHPHRHLFVCKDAERSIVADVVPNYKGERSGREGPSTAEKQAAVEPWLHAAGIPVRGAEGAEADHVIGALAGAAVDAGRSVSILSRDTDLLQLVSDARDVVVLWPEGGGDGEPQLDEAGVAARMLAKKEVRAPLPPSLILAMRVLAGGKDNLPKVGPPIAPGERAKGFSEARAAAVLLDARAEHHENPLAAVLFGEASMKPSEAAWLSPAVVAAAWARHEVLRLDCGRRFLPLMSKGGRSAVGHIDWSATPERPSQRGAEPTAADPLHTARCAGGCGKELPLQKGVEPARHRCVVCTAAKEMVPCDGHCGRMIPKDAGYSPNHCHACAFAYGQAYAERLRGEGRTPTCKAGCGRAMDLLALEHSDELICTTCRVQQRGSAARGRGDRAAA